MFDKILVANRGEIACRVIDSARGLGVRTVAVYSDADAGARHTTLADEAVRIGPPAPAESYLKIDRIIAAARQSGAQAIHPGYGFLSENPDFVDACTAAGITFIGPSAEAIRAMGLKDAAKALMERAGVPVVPGYHGDNQDDEHLAGAAEAIGWPVLIKAVAGGGGRGMRRVEASGDFAEALRAARAEARGAFGNDAVLIEKYVEKPRHIEVQVFGDGTRAVHLFERDCSLQRRHQKVIEEAPAPGMTDQMRSAMGQAAVRAAEAIGYRGAGTVEFIVDASEGLRPDRFWFMEMNTRLQVEHPVTEAVTGIDLVEWQLRVAAGEPLPRSQSDIHLSGHAIEARIYAEDVPAGFLPATGTLEHLRFAPAARIDTGVRQGDRITTYYDPMIAKLTVHGATRPIALSRLRAAISGTEVTGTVTNLAFLGRLVACEEFVAGDMDTGLIGRRLDSLAAADRAPPEVQALAAVAGAEIDAGADGFTLWSPLVHRVDLRGEGEEAPLAAEIIVTGIGRATGRVGETSVAAERRAGRWHDGQGRTAVASASEVVVIGPGPRGPGRWVFHRVDPLSREAAAEAEGLIVAPMPGLVRSVLAAAGDEVSAGTPLVVLEAMKMEHTMAAPHSGRLAEVLVAGGDQVEAGALLARMEAHP